MDRVHIPEVIEPDEKLPRDLVALRRFARLMDQEFSFPGTSFRFGLDAVLGLAPGVGDFVGAVMSTWIIAGALRHRVPGRVILRMVFNVAADLLFGAVPLAGDVFDFLFEQNSRNMRLLELHRDRRKPARSLARIVGVVAAVLVFLLLVAIGVLSAAALAVVWLVDYLR